MSLDDATKECVGETSTPFDIRNCIRPDNYDKIRTTLTLNKGDLEALMLPKCENVAFKGSNFTKFLVFSDIIKVI